MPDTTGEHIAKNEHQFSNQRQQLVENTFKCNADALTANGNASADASQELMKAYRELAKRASII